MFWRINGARVRLVQDKFRDDVGAFNLKSDDQNKSSTLKKNLIHMIWRFQSLWTPGHLLSRHFVMIGSSQYKKKLEWPRVFQKSLWFTSKLVFTLKKLCIINFTTFNTHFKIFPTKKIQTTKLLRGKPFVPTKTPQVFRRLDGVFFFNLIKESNWAHQNLSKKKNTVTINAKTTLLHGLHEPYCLSTHNRIVRATCTESKTLPKLQVSACLFSNYYRKLELDDPVSVCLAK